MSYAEDCGCCGREGTAYPATRDEPGDFECSTCEDGECRRCNAISEVLQLWLKARNDPDCPEEVADILKHTHAALEATR